MRTASEISSSLRKISLDERTIHLLAELRRSTEATSDSEVVRHALLCYENLVDDIIAQRTLLIRDATAQDFTVLLEASDSTERNVRLPIKRNLMLPISTSHCLDELQIKTGAASDSEVIREAIHAYASVVRHVQAGSHIVARDADGLEHYKTYLIPKVRLPRSALSGSIGKALVRLGP